MTVIGLPLAFLYLLSGTIRIESELEDPEAFAAQYRSGKLASKVSG